jgi:hypothetical protein
MSTENQGVMSRWMRESLTTLHQLRRERDLHEQALEAAMEAIRMHTQAIERVERDIAVIETAVAGSSGISEPEPIAVVEDEFETSEPTRVHLAPTVLPPRPPPLRPVPRAVG